MSTQARCSPPETEPLFSGSPPRLRTLACSSLTACLHRLAACSNICFNSGLFTPAAQVRKPSSPSRLVSIKLFNVSTRSPLSIQVSSATKHLGRQTPAVAINSKQMGDPNSKCSGTYSVSDAHSGSLSLYVEPTG